MNQMKEEYARNIVGILSNSQNKYKYSHFTQLMKRYIEENVGIIYICGGTVEKEAIDNHIKNISGEAYHNVIERQQLKIISRKDNKDVDDSNMEVFIKDVLIEIKKLESRSFKKIRVCINVDKSINLISKAGLDNAFKLFEHIAKNHDIRVILRFFMDEITNFEFFSLMADNGYFVVEDTTKDDFLLSHYPQIVTSSNLFSDSTIQETQPQYVKNRINNRDSFNQIIDEVSHDLKNIFATISGYTQLALLKSQSPEIKDYLKIILSNSLDIHGIFEKFHSSSPCPEKQREKYLINTLVMEASQMAFNMKRNKVNLGNRNISISYSLNSQKAIYCSECEMKQVIMNIVDNGIQALNGRGNIIINTYDSKDGAILEIVDNGTGIDEETQSKIFQPYFTTKKDLGTGLGLDIAKRTLENHGASISVESRLGFGSKFTIAFPMINDELNLDSKAGNIYNSI